MRLELSDAAQSDLREIALNIEIGAAATDIAETFVRNIVARCNYIASLPGTLGTDRSELRPGIRSTPYRNYVILFRYTTDTVEIVNVLHANRDIVRFYDDA